MTAHALFIGTNHYSDRSVPPLQCAQRDASELYHLFKRELGYGEHAHLLEAPKQEDVFQALDDIGQQVRAGDSFLLYFAGHGVEAADGQDQYLLLGGARMLLLHGAQGTPAGTLSVRDLVTLSDAWPRVQRVMVFDACRTRLVPTMGLDSAVQGLPVFGSEQVLRQIATRDPGLHRRRPAAAPAATQGALPPVFIKSCQSNQLAVELLARQRSVFGLAFDEVLQDARRAGQAVLANDGLLNALAQRMARLAEAHGVGGGQRPWMSEVLGSVCLYVPDAMARHFERGHDGRRDRAAAATGSPPREGADAHANLLERFERQIEAGRLSSPPWDCCIGTLALLHEAGVDETVLAAYRSRIDQAGQRPTSPAPAPAPPRPKVASPQISRPRAVTPSPAQPMTLAQRPAGYVFRDADWSPQMVVIPTGKFIMGSPEPEPERCRSEGPQRRVTIDRAYGIGRCVVTFNDYVRFSKEMQAEPPDDAGWGRGGRPVINVSWNDAQAYIAWLNQKLHFSGSTEYRLPTEAEWEFAARAGTTTAFWWGDEVDPGRANYDGRYAYAGGATGAYREYTVEADAFAPNPWGLFNVHGNVGEWVQDPWHPDYTGAPRNGSCWASGGNSTFRVARGGAWDYPPRFVRSADRSMLPQDDRHPVIGFRLARTL